MSGYSIKCSSDTTAKNKNLTPFYAVKYSIDMCAYPFEGNLPIEVLSNILDEVSNDNYSNLVLLFHNGAEALPIAGDYVFTNNDLLTTAGHIVNVFDQSFNPYTNQYFLLDHSIGEVSTVPVSIDNSGTVSNISCASEPAIILSFDNIQEEIGNPDLTNPAIWNTIANNLGSDTCNFTSVAIHGNTAYLMGNLAGINTFILNGYGINYANFDAATNLKTLDLSYNLLTHLDVSSFGLDNLIVSHNQLTNVSLPALENLTLSNNYLTEFPVFDMSMISSIYIDNNLITGLVSLNVDTLNNLICNDNDINSLTITGLSRPSVIEAKNNSINPVSFSNSILGQGCSIDLIGNNINVDNMILLLSTIISNGNKIHNIYLENGYNAPYTGNEMLTSQYHTIRDAIGLGNITMNH